MDLSGTGYVSAASSCEHGNEISGPIRDLEFLALLPGSNSE